jgi:serine/threonine-protein phosphatase 6 regulatory ankyrin repeat subunit B
LDLLQLFIDHGADVNVQKKDGETALIRAVNPCVSKSESMVKTLLQNSAKISLKNKKGEKAFDFAVYNNCRKAIRLLLEYGEDVNQNDKNGATYLMKASLNERVPIVKTLLKNGANVSLKGAKWNDTALHFGCIGGSLEVVDLLIKHGAKIDTRNKRGVTPLMYASAKGHVKIVERLLGKGADVNVKLNNGVTALKIAQKRKHHEVEEILKRHGAT